MKLSKEKQAEIYCVKHGHANYIWKCWGYVHCGRCGSQIGDQLGGIYDTTSIMVIGCKDKPCKVCDPIKKKLNAMDKQILARLEKTDACRDYKKILRGIEIK